MEKQKNKMVRNLLYSICLHLLFIMFILFNEKINNAFNGNILNINGLNIESDFLEKNDIKVSGDNIYSNLTLSEKVELYELSKKNYDKNKKFTEFNEKLVKNKLKNYEKEEALSLENSDDIDNKNLENNKILYLGPTDYKKLLDKIEREKKEEEEKLKKEEDKKIVVAVSKVETIQDNSAIRSNTGGATGMGTKTENSPKDDGKNNIKDSKKPQNNDVKELLKPILTENNGGNGEKYTENVETGKINNNSINPIMAKMVDKRITQILDRNIKNDNKDKKKSDEEAVEVKKEEEDVEDMEKFNIDIDRIFTKEDLKNIKKILMEENLSILTLREKVNIQNQIIMCYKNAILQTKKNSKVRVSATLKLFQDGIIDTKQIKIKILDDKNEFDKEEYNNAIENVKVALAYCNPLRNLPLTKYQSWKNINFIFDTTTVNQ